MTGRPPKPTALHLIEGTRPHRRRDREPRPVGDLGNPPARLGRREARVWREVAAAYSPGTYTVADRLLVERLAVTMTRWRDADAELRRTGLTSRGQRGETCKHPLATIANNLGAEVDRLATQLGLSPTSRVRV